MAETLLIVLLAHYHRPERDKLRNVRTDQALPPLPVPMARSANPDVDVDSVLLGCRDTDRGCAVEGLVQIPAMAWIRPSAMALTKVS
jgi:hypothetical protein